MRRFFALLPWILLLIVIAAFGWWRSHQIPIAPKAADGVQMPTEKSTPLIDSSKMGGVVSYSQAVKVAAPAVVNIFTLQKATALNHPNAEMLRELFGDQIPDQALNQEQTSLGSGVIVRADGYILTNNHVVAQADEIVVGLQDGRKVKAQVIGTDPETDLAVIKVELTRLPVLPFKLSGNEVGDVVLAIGNPFGVGQTVTQGIISATGRTGLGINTYEDFIQTDAAINPGNSGGALIDVAGNLIGINTAIFSRTGGSMGIGFAIPAQICQHVLNGILKEGKVVRGWLGIAVKGLNNNDVLNVNNVQGVQVVEVMANGPAAQSGLRQGDIIVRLDQTLIDSANQLTAYVAEQTPGHQIQTEVMRGDQKIKLTLTVGTRPDHQSRSRQYVPLPQPR